MLIRWLKVFSITPIFLFFVSFNNFAENKLSEQALCQLKQIKSLPENSKITQVIDKCKDLAAEPTIHGGALTKRLLQERKTSFNPYVITPHKMNYILPVSYTSGFNDKIEVDPTLSQAARNLEAKFQMSFKVPLNYGDLLTEGDALFFGLTMQSWWQLYTTEISKPFRETNYQPEVFYYLPVNWQLLDTTTSLVFGLEHQSNGRTLPLSRSWNRLYFSILVEDQNWVLNLRPWWRLPESKTKDQTDPNRDDNPDIAEYMGYFELNGAYRIDQNMQMQFMLRQNINTNRGAVEVGFTFPLWGRLRGYTQYFNGYGESLIDYNYTQQRISVGIALTDLL